MASSRASSPTGSTSDGKFDLSPRSRLKALLATVGSDSEGDNPSPSKTPQGEKTTILRTSSPDRPAVESSEDEDDNDEVIVRPRGRLAARMLGTDKPIEKSQSDKQDDARERVKKMLQKAAEPANSTETTEDVNMADAEDDADELPVQRRKLKNRQHRSTTPRTATPARSPSPAPSLFVTPDKADSPIQHSQDAEHNDDSDSDVPAIKSDRFKALVDKKRAERKAREAEEERKKAARMAAQAALIQDESEDDVSDITDDEGGRKLTQEVKRPAARKASKKALEEMNRETQRMSRALQLAHEAKTKKKITKASLFERFNFKPEKPEGVAVKEPATSSSRPATPTSSTHTDTEMKDAETPPSSPPARIEDVLGKPPTAASSTGVQQIDAHAQLTGHLDLEGDDMPTIEEFLATSSSRKQEISKAPMQTTEPTKDKKSTTTTKRNIRVKLPAMKANLVTIDSDEELVITETKKSKIDAIFDRIPEKKAKESNSIHALRRLAHLDSPEKKPNRKVTKTGITAGELQAQLQQRARQQAKLERDRRLEMLKAKGIHIQTEEERERELAQVEDIVSRARHEAEEIMQREREAAKKAKKESGETDPLAWDDSDDSSFAGDAQEEPSEIELSGSEGEDDSIAAENSGSEHEDEDEDAVEDSNKKKSGASTMFDEEAESNESESDDWVDPDEEEERNRWGASDEEDAQDIVTKTKPRRSKKHVTILSDDEDIDVESTPKPKTQYPQSPAVPKTDSPQVPTSVLRSATKTFIPGLPVTMGGPAGLGLTQIFAGTMDDSQAGPASGSPMEFMPTFDSFPETQMSQAAENDMIYDSQPQDTQKESQGVHLDITQSQEHGFDSILNDFRETQTSDMLEPSQDVGFQNYTPLKERFIEAPNSTIDTVVLNSTQHTQPHEVQHESPLVQRKGRLRRKIAQAPESETEDEADRNDMVIEEDEFGFGTTNAFNAMKDAALKEKKRKARHDFDKKKSKAREMVEDQAEESEDEYAGLGGADGDDSDNESSASVHEMIDDNTQLNALDDAKLAAFYADRERANDEKQVDKLFRDITSGMLRRKRGADYDLSDSDDGGEARRRMKRRQFAKMQKALFADERISKVAENPRNQAFMKTIEDVGSDDEMDFLFEPPPPPPQSQDSQSQEARIVPDSQPTAARQPLAPANGVNRPPAAARRTKDGKKPSNIGEIRESLSNLLEEPSLNTVISATDFGSDSDDADNEDQRPRSSNKENNAPQNPRRTNNIVDRINLKRQGSSSASASAGGRMAFAAPSATNSGSFKVPALLRRATTNSLMSSSGSSSGGNGHATGGGGFGEEAKIKKSAGKRSGINYFARENERRAAMEESAKRREAKKFKGAEGRVKVVGGLFGAGKFE